MSGNWCPYRNIYELFYDCMSTMPPASPPPPPPSGPPSDEPDVCVEGWPGQAQAGSSLRAAQPLDGSSSGYIKFLDPVPDLQTEDGKDVTDNKDILGTMGTPVKAVAADSAARVVLRIPACRVNQKLTLTLLKDPNGTLATPTDQVGTVSALGASENRLDLEVKADRKVDGIPTAYAVYRPPEDFVRSGVLSDLTAVFRPIYFKVKPSKAKDENSTYVSNLDLLRPPVVLVHGLWDSRSAWNSFPLFSNPPRDNGAVLFTISRANYDRPLFVTWGSPSADPTDVLTTYVPAALASANANQLSFTYNAPYVHGQIANAIVSFRQGDNSLKVRAASAQADVVAHSMGGLVTRDISLLPEYVDKASFDAGNIHKLITIGTPHYGTPFATEVLKDPLVESILALQGRLAFGWGVVVGWQLMVPGAVYDMQGDTTGTGGGLTPNLTALNAQGNPHPLRVAAIAGRLDPDTNLQGLSSRWRKVQKPAAQIVGSLYGCGPCKIESALSAGTWNTVFGGNDSDAMVSVTSQLASRGQESFLGVIHSPSLEALGFSGPGELEKQSGIPGWVLFLLNQPAGSDYFTNF